MLGQLAERGQMHGHEIRRNAERTDVGVWGGVPIGSLYRELHLMADEGLVEAVRSEQIGRRPERTIYQITRDGRIELEVLREQALREFSHPADPIGVALLFAGGPDPAMWTQLLASRRRHIAALLQNMSEERARHSARARLTPLAVAAFRRGELRLAAELAWYAECDALLAELEPDPVQAGPPGALPAPQPESEPAAEP